MFTHLKRRIGVLSAVAVLAALVPVLAVSTVSAAPALTADAPDFPATASACPAGSAAAAGFTDTTSTDVDCIKMHGITQGVTATTYEPASSIPRWQMALYLTRFATSAGVTLGTGADQGFTDISGYAADIQTAINQIKQLGVTTGTTATTYSPDSNVTREQMAMFTERMLGKTVAGPGGKGAVASYAGLITHATVGSYNYTDIDSGSVTYEGHNSIVEMYHLGIQGDAKTVTTFNPAGDMTRGDMATWMTNALAHTNARPAGLWSQATTASAFGTAVTLWISNRDANRQPIAGTPVDMFSDVNSANTAPFSATGGCNTTSTVELGNAVTECKVDVGDMSTDSKGNIGGHDGHTGGTVAAALTTSYYAWTAATGTSYNNLTAPATNTQSVTPLNGVALLYLTNTIPLNNRNDDTDTTFEMVKYGTTVTISGQWLNASLGAVPWPAGVKIVEQRLEEGDDGANTDNLAGNVVVSITTTVLATDATGAFSHSVTIADPTPVGTALSSLASRTHTITGITADSTGDGVYDTNVGIVNLAWDDNPSVASVVGVAEGTAYGSGLSAVYGGVARTISATVYDQFGTGMAGQTVSFASAQTSGSTALGETKVFTDATTRVSDSTGVATLAFTDTEEGTAKMVTTATSTVAGTSTFYRILTSEPNFTETEASVTDGTVVATNFNTDVNGLLTFDGSHSLAVGQQVIVDLGTITAAVGGAVTVTAHADDEFIFASVHGLAIGDVLKNSVAIGASNTNGITANDFVCVRTVVSTTVVTLTAALGTPQLPCSAASAVLDVTVNSNDTAGRMVRVMFPLGQYYVATVPAVATATLSATRTISAAGAVTYSTYGADLVGAGSTGTMKLTSATEFDTGDLYMEVVIQDAANDTFVAANKLGAADWDYHAYTYDSGDQFNILGDQGAGATATTMAGFELNLGAKMNSTTGVANATQVGDLVGITYVNENEGGGTSVFTLGS
jgi:hypothetical protein